MSTIQLFTETDFKGLTVTLNKDTPDLSTVDFLNKARSLIVLGGPWIVFSISDHQGEFKYYPVGNYRSLSLWDNKICSVRVVKGGLDDPNITLYDEIDYAGNRMTLEGPVPSLPNLVFKLSSYKVASGAWIFYSAEEYKDDKAITLAGDAIPDISTIGWENKVRSLKPIKDGDE